LFSWHPPVVVDFLQTFATMVRQMEVEKPRRSNMVRSSINATPKKGGSGGSFTWGRAEDVLDYEHTGFEEGSVGVTTAVVFTQATNASDSSTSCSINLEDEEAFPALTVATKEFTPEKLAKPVSLADDCVPQDPMEEKSAADWVVVSPVEDTKKTGTFYSTTMESFDSQHPRNTFTKKVASKQDIVAKTKQGHGIDVDWSQEGIPTEVKRQIIHASRNSAHHGVHAAKQTSPVPFTILRAQSASTSKRSSSVPKTPRAHSKPRMIQQPRRR